MSAALLLLVVGGALFAAAWFAWALPGPHPSGVTAAILASVGALAVFGGVLILLPSVPVAGAMSVAYVLLVVLTRMGISATEVVPRPREPRPADEPSPGRG